MQYYPNLFKRKRYKWTEMVLFREGVGKCCHLYISHHSRIRLYAAKRSFRDIEVSKLVSGPFSNHYVSGRKK